MRMKLTAWICLFLVFVQSQAALAWSEGGHHLIAAMAFKMLPEARQAELLEILSHHPRYAEDLKIPDNVKEPADRKLWLIGRAGYWPDVARRQGEFNRPEWHYEDAVALTIGDVSSLKLPKTNTVLPNDATLATRDLHITQAVELAKKTLDDPHAAKADKAIAICWLAHLTADAHQPCHAGSLYAPFVFPKGDRGANGIPTKQRENMHALWDGLLGPRYSRADVNRRMTEYMQSKELQQASKQAIEKPKGLQCTTWLEESRELAKTYVYSEPVREAVSVAVRSGTDVLTPIELAEDALKQAGHVSQRRAMEGAARLSQLMK